MYHGISSQHKKLQFAKCWRDWEYPLWLVDSLYPGCDTHVACEVDEVLYSVPHLKNIKFVAIATTRAATLAADFISRKFSTCCKKLLIWPSCFHKCRCSPFERCSMMYIEGDISLDAMQQSCIHTCTLLVYMLYCQSANSLCNLVRLFYKILFPYFVHFYVNDKGKLLDKAFLTLIKFVRMLCAWICTIWCRHFYISRQIKYWYILPYCMV